MCRHPSVLIGLLLALLTGLAGCGPYTPRWPPPADASPAFKEGYADGCFTGSEEATFDPYPRVRKNEARFQKDTQYREGWKEGHRICYERSRDRLRLLDLPGGAK